jgi:antitoxin PrlF
MKHTTPNAPGRRRGEAQNVLANPSPAHFAGPSNTEIGNYSRVTERAQTTLPKGVRNALGAGPGSTLSWTIQGDVAVVKVQGSEQADPVVTAFLSFLEKDMIAHPEHIKAFPADLLERGLALTAGIVVNLDEPLE